MMILAKFEWYHNNSDIYNNYYISCRRRRFPIPERQLSSYNSKDKDQSSPLIAILIQVIWLQLSWVSIARSSSHLPTIVRQAKTQAIRKGGFIFLSAVLVFIQKSSLSLKRCNS